jgi:hypothetical protein
VISSVAESPAPPVSAEMPALRLRPIHKTLLLLAAFVVLGLMTWQGLTTGGSPDPTRANTSRNVAVLDIGFFFGLDPMTVSGASRIIVAEKNGMVAGLMVAQVES